MDYRPQGVSVAASLEEALELARTVEVEGVNGVADEIMIIGGEQIYRLALPLADRLYLTRVAAEVPGDALFPAIDDDQWLEVASSDPEVPGDPPYSFHTLDRRR